MARGPLLRSPSSGVRHGKVHSLGPGFHPPADLARGSERGDHRGPGHADARAAPECRGAVGIAHGYGRQQQPGTRAITVRRGRHRIPAADDAGVGHRQSGHHPIAIPARHVRHRLFPTWHHRRCHPAHRIEPDRRPDGEQSGRGRGGIDERQPGTFPDPRQPRHEPRARRPIRPQPGHWHQRRHAGLLHTEHDAGLRPDRAVQLVDDVLRPVLRSRPRPAAEEQDRNRLHSAAAGRSALQYHTEPFHGALARGGRDGCDGRGRTGKRTEHHLAFRRPEPDLYLASFASGVPARVRHGRRQARRHRQAADRSRDRRRPHHRRLAPRRRQGRHGDLGRSQGAGARHARHRAH